MTNPGEQFLDIPVDAPIIAEIERIKYERIHAPREEISTQTLENYVADLPAHVADLSYFGEQIEETQAKRLASLQWQRTCFDFSVQFEGEAASQSDLLEPESRETQFECIELSRMFITLTHQAAKELMPTAPERMREEGISALLSLESRDPFAMMIRWNIVANVILAQQRKVLQVMTLQMKPYLSPQENLQIHNDILANIDLKYAHFIPGARILEGFMRSTKHDTRKIPKELRADYLALYKEWKAAMRADANEAVTETLNTMAAQIAYLEIMQRPEEFETQLIAAADAIYANRKSEGVPSSAEAEAQLLQQELSAIIEAHGKKAAVFRPSWHQAQKPGPGIKAFSNELLRLSRDEKDAPPSKRITRLLHALEHLGSTTSDPANLYEQFTSFLTVEYVITDKVKMAQEALNRAGIRADVAAWEPVSDDLEFIITHWKEWILPTALTHWAPKTGTRTDAIAAIELVLTQYKRAKRELLHPEDRLAAVAKPLGVVALPTEARPQPLKSNRELKRLTVKKRFKEIREDASAPEDMRERAAVIEHFLDLAESQRTAADDPNFGELFLTERSEHHDKRYFCVRFRDDNQKEWALLECLERETKTYMVPMDVVHSLGSLEEFVAGFGKTAQVELGSEYAQHRTGWTAETHIARIMAKLSKARPQ